MKTARPYLTIRAFSFMPMLISFVGFSACRGTMDVKASVKITLTASAITALLDPLLIHVFGMGVCGAAIATVTGDVICAMIYLKLLLEKNLIRVDKLLRVPSWKSIAPLLKGGVALQIRSFAMILTGMLVARTVQSLDSNGIAPAAHALVFQFVQMGGILLGALGMSTQTMVPNAMAKGLEEARSGSSLSPSEALVRRLFKWGLKLGFGIGLIQLLLLPNILSSSPLLEVREAARTPALIAIAFQGINGIINVGEGVLMGTGNFTWLSINIILASLCYAVALRFLSGPFGLTGVWMSLSVFTTVRLVGVLASPVIRQKTGVWSEANVV
jgi:putative MATE family efflux protein